MRCVVLFDPASLSVTFFVCLSVSAERGESSVGKEKKEQRACVGKEGRKEGRRKEEKGRRKKEEGSFFQEQEERKEKKRKRKEKKRKEKKRKEPQNRKERTERLTYSRESE